MLWHFLKRRISKAMNTINSLLGSVYLPVRKVASFIGQIISMSIVIGPVAQIMTRYLSKLFYKPKCYIRYLMNHSIPFLPSFLVKDLQIL